MEKQKNYGMKIIQLTLGFMMTAAFLFFIIGEMMLPLEGFSGDGVCQIWQADWERIMPDGTKVPITVPGQCEAGRGEWVTIVTTLPQDQVDTSFCIRSLQQDFKIYVGDELREEYSTIDTQLFGKTSTIAYVFFEISSEDAGKVLRIEHMSESSHSGFVSEIYTGERSEIWKYFLKLYAPTAIVAMFMLMMSIVVVCDALFIQFRYKREVEMLHLGNAVLIASAWLIAESRVRQFIMPNNTIAMYLGFFMIMLLPYPFISYVNLVQKRRYQKAYMAVGICAIVNGIISTLLQVLNIKDFYETMGISHIIIILMILIFVVTITLDIRRGYVGEYRAVALGFGALMVAGVGEIYMVYVSSSHYNGIPLCIGLVVLLLMAGVKTSQDVMKNEQEKQIALAASESKARFLANMSHEIRTPINTVIGMNEMILRENEDDIIEEYALNIKSASQMLLGLINDVLDLSKIEAGKLEIVESDYSLASMLNDVVLGIKVRAEKKNLKFLLEIDESMPAVLRGDEIRIKQVLNNLLSNAVKYTEKGSITFSAQGVRDENGFLLLLSVRDTGIGIRKEDIEKLFDSFQRLELKKNRNIEGTGLGLSITKQLVDHMYGTMNVESEHGKGSCFTVQIPQQIVDEKAMGNLEQKYRDVALKKDVAKEILVAPDARVLIVDDNKMNLKVMQALLKRTQIQVEFATGGNQCLQMTKKKKYDIILMDHMMPEPDGVQTLHLLRKDADNINRDTKVIVLTANAIEGVAEEYLREGFTDYLSKPVEATKLERMLAKYLAK